MSIKDVQNLLRIFKKKHRAYWPLIKYLQTALLMVTGFTGYVSARPEITLSTVIGLLGSLFLAISGSTALNMVLDRDIDGKMLRTVHRPIPSGTVSPKEAFVFGIFLSITGLGWALSLSILYGAVLFAGLFFDVFIYTLWLKRKTPWSIVWGGISGGMPILAGRVLGLGRFDGIGLMLALAVLLWIPTHIMTFNLRHESDYRRAKVPTFPSEYGSQKTRWIIAFSILGAATAMGIGAWALELSGGYIRLQAVLSFGILGLAVSSVIQPSEKANFGLFKYASLYMLGSMLMMVLGALRS